MSAGWPGGRALPALRRHRVRDRREGRARVRPALRLPPRARPRAPTPSSTPAASRAATSTAASPPSTPGNAVADRARSSKAMSYCNGYPYIGPEDEGLGLLFTGDNGVGKTHLAVSVLRELVTVEGRARPVLGLPRADPRDQELLQPGDEDHRAAGAGARGRDRRAAPRRPRGVEDDGLDERHAVLHPEQPLHGQARDPHHHQLRGRRPRRRCWPPTTCGARST